MCYLLEASPNNKCSPKHGRAVRGTRPAPREDNKRCAVTRSEGLELVALMLGLHDWNELSARIQSESQPPDVKPAGIIPPPRHRLPY
jgi:hypothetical protein